MEWHGVKLAGEPGPKLYGALPGTAFGSKLMEQMAEAAIKGEDLGKDEDTDLLLLSFSSNDYVGHSYGPDSSQVREMSIATDQCLGALFKYLDARIGMSNVLIVFAADHGVDPMPEANAARKMPGGRIAFSTIRNAIQKALQEKYGEGNWVMAAPEEAIYLNWDLIQSKKLHEQEVANEAARVARMLPDIFRVYTRDQLLNGMNTADPIGRRIANSYSSSRGADLYVIPNPYYIFVEGKMTTHGSPFVYDTHVPLIFMGPGIKPGRYDGNVAIIDIAPTLATMLGVEIPSGAEGRILSEMLMDK
jgi:arylsulfatase A-like enzyme